MNKKLAQKKINELLKLRSKACSDMLPTIDCDTISLESNLKNNNIRYFDSNLDAVKDDIDGIKQIEEVEKNTSKKKWLQGMYRKLDQVVTKALKGIKNDKKHGIENKDKLFDRVSRVSKVMDINKKIEDKTSPGGDGIANLNIHLIKIFSESEYAPKLVTGPDGIDEPIWTNHSLYGCLSVFKECVVIPLVINPIKNADNF